MKKTILKYLSQILLIVFSVVLGILLSEKIEEHKNKKESELLFSKIQSELKNNKLVLEEWVPYHKMVVKRLDSLYNDKKFVKSFIDNQGILFEKILTKGTLMGGFPTNDAWDIAKSHPLIVHFDYDELLVISKIYNQQDMTYQSVPKILEIFLSPNFNDKKNAEDNLYLFNNLMHETLSRETQLLEYLNEADKKFGL